MASLTLHQTLLDRQHLEEFEPNSTSAFAPDLRPGESGVTQRTGSSRVLIVVGRNKIDL